MTDHVLSVLRELVQERMGARPDGLIVRELARRLEAIARRAPSASVAEALRKASPSDPVFASVVSELTIGETWFFRDPSFFRFLDERVFPELRARGGTSRIWSAGCSTGEETHSIAFAARRALHEAIEVLGTDIDPERLAVAKARRYPPRSARSVALPAFFASEVEGDLVVREPPAVRVSFAPHNLARDAAPRGGFDVVVCRNALLYLHEAAVTRALETFKSALRPGGWVLLGPSDVIDRPQVLPAWLEAVPGSPTFFKMRTSSPEESRRDLAKAPTRPISLAPPSPAPASAPPTEVAPSPPASAVGKPTPATGRRSALKELVLAEARLDAGDDEAAERACLAALEVDPSSLDGALLVARIAVARSETKLARALLLALRDEHPNEARVRRALEALP